MPYGAVLLVHAMQNAFGRLFLVEIHLLFIEIGRHGSEAVLLIVFYPSRVPM